VGDLGNTQLKPFLLLLLLKSSCHYSTISFRLLLLRPQVSSNFLSTKWGETVVLSVLARVMQNLAFTSIRSTLTIFESNIEPCRKGRLNGQQALRRGCAMELYESQASLGTGSSLWPSVCFLLKQQLAFSGLCSYECVSKRYAHSMKLTTTILSIVRYCFGNSHRMHVSSHPILCTLFCQSTSTRPSTQFAVREYHEHNNKL